MSEAEQGTELEKILEEEEDTSATWITTFSDLSLLLLTFFVLLYSMSFLDAKKFSSYFLSVQRALGTAEGGQLAQKSSLNESAGVFIKEARLLKQLNEKQSQVFADFNFYFTDKGLEGIVGAKLESGMITIQVPGDVLFASGQVELTAKGREVIRKLKDFFIKHSDQKINIIGYTDDVPPKKGSRFKDNWEISALRALSVLRYMIKMGIPPSRLTATGLADLNPVLPNNTAQNRAKNRRVEFVLTRDIGGME